MVGIIDVGGGLRDIYGAGVFDRLLDDGVKLDYCLGVSAGSGNVASYMAGQRGRNHRFYIDYSKRKEYMSFSNFIKRGSYIDLDYIYGTLSNSGGEDPLDYEALSSNKGKMVVVTTNAKTGKIEYFDKSHVSKDDYSILMASSAIPGACKPRKIGELLCADGGVGEPIPIEKAFKDGCDKVILILTVPDGPMEQKKRDLIGSKVFKINMPAIAKLLGIRHNIYNRQLELAHEYEKQGKCLIISPDDVCGIKTLTNDSEKLEQLYQKGYEDGARVKEFALG